MHPALPALYLTALALSTNRHGELLRLRACVAAGLVPDGPGAAGPGRGAPATARAVQAAHEGVGPGAVW